MTVLHPVNLSPVGAEPDGFGLHLHTQGRGRVPGRAAPQFDLDAFSQALEQHDTDYQFACYAPDADIRVVDPDNPPQAPSMVRGAADIHGWLLDGKTRELDLRVTHQVDGGDRVAFTEQWHYQDGHNGQATSTAELQNGLITTQHTILVWGQHWL